MGTGEVLKAGDLKLTGIRSGVIQITVKR